jgi:2,3-bisphosphoglycerate-independent phosphoglycerate mutase
MPLSLNKLQSYKGRKGPLLLIIMDGIGIGKKDESNAVFQAKTPHLDSLFKTELFTELRAHGTAVGLPSDDDMGNSEVGHNAIGAGRIFDRAPAWSTRRSNRGDLSNRGLGHDRRARTKRRDGPFIGLLSDGNVHSHIDSCLF